MATDYFGARGANRSRTRRVTNWAEINHPEARKMLPIVNLLRKEPLTYPDYVKEIKEMRRMLLNNFERIHHQVRANLLASIRRREEMLVGRAAVGGDDDTTQPLDYSDQVTLNASQASSGYYGSQEMNKGTLRVYEE